jgi:replicative DNA helicase
MQPAARTETLPPPSDAALEAAVLGALLLEADAVPTALALLKGEAEVFYHPAHQYVFRAVLTLHQRGWAIDQLTVVEELRKTKLLEKAGGMGAVAGLTLHIHSAAHLATHCLSLLDLYAKRIVGRIGYDFQRQAYRRDTDPHELLAEAQRAINSLHAVLQVRQARTLGELFEEAVERAVAVAGTPGGVTGVPSGLAAVDNLTGGWQPSDLIILAARPGMGKTSFALFCANHAQAQGHGGAFFSLEMGAGQLATKAVATASGHSTAQLTKGVGMTPDMARDLRRTAGALASSGLLIDDTPALSIGELRAKVSKAVAERGVRVVYVDYLQLMSGEKSGNREQEIGSISRGLKLIAKENNVPVIALAQLSRAVETRGGDKKPQLSDLRESGSIEQDADLVAFLYRAEYYKITEDDEGNPTAGLCEFILAKQRNGATRTAVVQCDLEKGRYWDLEKDAPFTVPANRPGAFPTSTFDEAPY